MAENKDKKLKADSVPENDTLSEQEKEKVSEILANLKNSKNEASTDWDGLADVSAAKKDIVEDEPASKPKKSGKKKKKEEEEIPEEELCVICGKRRRISEDTAYCKSCREKLKKTPLNFFGILAFVVVLFAGCVAIVFGYHSVNISIPVIKGDKLMKEGKYYSALAYYSEAEAYAQFLNDEWNQTDEQQEVPTTLPSKPITWFDAGKRTKVKILDGYYQAGSLISFQNYVEELERLGLAENKRYPQVKEYNDILDVFGTTCSFIQNKYQNLIFAMQSSNGQMKMEDVKPALDELEKLKTNEHHNKYAVAYMQFKFAEAVPGSEDLQIKYLEEIKEGGKAYEEMTPLLCRLYLMTEQYDKVEKICSDAVAAAPESVDYYQYLMKVRIKQNNPQAALKIFEDVNNIVSSVYVAKDPKTGLADADRKLSVPYTFYEQKAVAHALLGQSNEAIEAIDEAYYMLADGQNPQIDINTANIYTLLHYVYHVKGNEPKYEGNMKIEDHIDNGYDIMVSIFARSNVEFNADVKAVIEGKKTLKDVFVDGEAYLQ